jgi:hypothetical protein
MQLPAQYERQFYVSNGLDLETADSVIRDGQWYLSLVTPLPSDRQFVADARSRTAQESFSLSCLQGRSILNSAGLRSEKCLRTPIIWWRRASRGGRMEKSAGSPRDNADSRLTLSRESCAVALSMAGK